MAPRQRFDLAKPAKLRGSVHVSLAAAALFASSSLLASHSSPLTALFLTNPSNTRDILWKATAGKSFQPCVWKEPSWTFPVAPQLLHSSSCGCYMYVKVGLFDILNLQNIPATNFLVFFVSGWLARCLLPAYGCHVALFLPHAHACRVAPVRGGGGGCRCNRPPCGREDARGKGRAAAGDHRRSQG